MGGYSHFRAVKIIKYYLSLFTFTLFMSAHSKLNNRIKLIFVYSRKTTRKDNNKDVE